MNFFGFQTIPIKMDQSIKQSINERQTRAGSSQQLVSRKNRARARKGAAQ